MERLLGPDMDLRPKQLLKILNQPGMIQQTPARLPRDQQIEIAVLIGVTAGHGTEYTYVKSATTLGEAEDLFPPYRTQCVQVDHVFIVLDRQPIQARLDGKPLPDGRGSVLVAAR